MNFSVIWDPDAEQELAAVWVRAADRAAVTRAAYELERRLRTNPDAEGESRPRGRRVTFERPAGMLFRVYAADHIVRVINVWEFR